MHVVVRADGGPEIGYGHLVRTGALASELLDRNHDVTYATTTPEHVREVCPMEAEIVMLPSRDNPIPAKEFVRDHADVTVVDSYLADGEYQQELRTVTPLVIIADDTRHRMATDVLVNENIYVLGLTYETICEEPARCIGQDSPHSSQIRCIRFERLSLYESPIYIIMTGNSDVTKLSPAIVDSSGSIDL